MSAISLINSGVAWFVAAAVLAFLFSFQKALSGWIAGIGGAVGSLYTAAAGFTVLTGAVGVSGALSLVSYDVQISPLNAIWLITLGLCGLFVSLYNIDWHRHAQVKCNGLQINMLMAAAVCAVIASNLGMFVVMAEIMALCAVFLTSNSKEGKLWFALGRLGTLLLAIACWLLWQRYGTLDLRLLDMRMQQLPLGSDIWLLGVIGFGLLAGIIPLHGWVPQAHANASAPAAALFSTVVMKIGLLGILTLSLLGGNAPLWWGIALLVLGMITAFVGGLYALMEHNIQRLLAYHTLENIGIILLGLGAGVTGIALEQPALIALGLWVAAQVAGSTNISNITDTVYHWPLSQSIPLVLALCACAFATFIEMGKLPFDLAEAEQELQEGPLSEYSGSGFGVMKWGISLKQLVVLQMFVGVFIPWGQMETFTVGGLLLALVIAIVKLVVGVLVIALFENSMARLRLDITPRITWAGFGFAFLAFVSLLAA